MRGLLFRRLLQARYYLYIITTISSVIDVWRIFVLVVVHHFHVDHYDFRRFRYRRAFVKTVCFPIVFNGKNVFRACYDVPRPCVVIVVYHVFATVAGYLHLRHQTQRRICRRFVGRRFLRTGFDFINRFLDETRQCHDNRDYAMLFST